MLVTRVRRGLYLRDGEGGEFSNRKAKGTFYIQKLKGRGMGIGDGPYDKGRAFAC